MWQTLDIACWAEWVCVCLCVRVLVCAWRMFCSILVCVREGSRGANCGGFGAAYRYRMGMNLCVYYTVLERVRMCASHDEPHGYIFSVNLREAVMLALVVMWVRLRVWMRIWTLYFSFFSFVFFSFFFLSYQAGSVAVSAPLAKALWSRLLWPSSSLVVA